LSFYIVFKVPKEKKTMPMFSKEYIYSWYLQFTGETSEVKTSVQLNR
jgi:hypothetical protein